LLILPVFFLWKELQEQQQRGWLVVVLLTFYLVACVPAWDFQGVGWNALFSVPRLYALIGMCVICCYLMLRDRDMDGWFGWNEVMWVVAASCGLVFAVVIGLLHQRGLYADYTERLPMAPGVLMARMPVVGDDGVSFVAMARGGYQTGIYRSGVASLSGNTLDELAVSVAGGDRWVEEVDRQSNIVSANSRQIEVTDGESPVVTTDGKRMAFLREDGGRARLWIHEIGKSRKEDRALTSAGVNVLDMSFWGSDKIIFAADAEGRGAKLFTVDMNGNVKPLLEVQARYPSMSPDGKWLAYSRLDRGYWNLWIREMRGGETMRVTDAECNSIEPSWDKDSVTLVYASDCGRALWFTALYKRRVAP
jgi:hypothetical protein